MPYYHIRITPKSPPLDDEIELDISLERLVERFVEPYRRGRSLVISGRAMTSEDIGRVQINKTERNSHDLNIAIQAQLASRQSFMGVDHKGRLPAYILADNGEDVTNEFITGSPGSESESIAQSSREVGPATDAREVFVVQGRNGVARDALFEFLRAIDLHPLEWSEATKFTGKPSPYIGEILDAAFSRAHAVVVLFTPDDETRLRGPFRAENDPLHETQLTGQARPNVLFEAGMAMARDQDRTVLVELGILRPFTDIAGLHVIRLDNSSPRRQELAQRLQSAGCPVKLDGTDWHTAGDFEGAVVVLEGTSELAAVEERQSTGADYQSLSEDARKLLVEAANSSTGYILRVSLMVGLSITANGKEFAEKGNRRSEAKWDQAIQDLLDLELVNDSEGKREALKVTHKGFQVADVFQSPE